MSEFSIFSYLDPALVSTESSTVRASKTPAFWPSGASAERIDKSLFPIFGTCQRKEVYRMIGWPMSAGSTSAESAWKWVVGRAVEEKLTDLTKVQSSKTGLEHIFIANGVRLYISEFYLPIEIDLIVRDPKTNKGWVIECKTYDGYYKEKQIEKEKKPSEENLIQACIYIWETQNGAKLKSLIKESLAEKVLLDKKQEESLGTGKIFTHRNRCEADLEKLELLNDGPLGCKLVYISRGALTRTEFDIEIMQDMDGFHYPMVNGMPYKLFTIESIYDRFRTGQNYWFRMRQEAVERLSKKGVNPPDSVQLVLNRGDISASQTTTRELSKEEWSAEKSYYDQLEAEVRSLPEEFFPAPEYEWSYSKDRVEELYKAKSLSKKAYENFTKTGERVGDWHCSFCPYAKMGCVAKQRPELNYIAYDFANIPEDLEVSIGY
jgi:hypothetical protein